MFHRINEGETFGTIPFHTIFDVMEIEIRRIYICTMEDHRRQVVVLITVADKFHITQ